MEPTDNLCDILAESSWDFASIFAVEYADEFEVVLHHLTNGKHVELAHAMTEIRERLDTSDVAKRNGYISYDDISILITPEERSVLNQCLQVLRRGL